MRLNEESCPVPESLLGQLYRVTPQGLPALIDAVPANTRAMLAVYCYRRAHLASLGIAIAASCAVTGSFSWPALFMGGANLLWVAGFDVIYGAQDYDFDVANGIHSMPARFGVDVALKLSSLMHLGAVACLAAVGLLLPALGVIYWAGLVIIAALLIAEHRIVAPGKLEHAKIAAYGVNQIVSVVFLLAGLLDVYL